MKQIEPMNILQIASFAGPPREASKDNARWEQQIRALYCFWIKHHNFWLQFDNGKSLWVYRLVIINKDKYQSVKINEHLKFVARYLLFSNCRIYEEDAHNFVLYISLHLHLSNITIKELDLENTNGPK